MRVAYEDAMAKVPMAKVRVRQPLPLLVGPAPTVPGRVEWLRAELLKTRVAHGYCSRHLVAEACPYANACGTQSWSFAPAAWSMPAQRGSIAGPDLRRDTVAAPATPGRMSRGFGHGVRIVCR